MDSSHDTIIYAVVGIIICVQLFFFLKNFKKILAYKNIIAANENLSVIELKIDEEKATTMEPEYFIENKRFFESTKELDSENYLEESNNRESFEVNDENNEHGDYGNITEYEFDNDDDNDDPNLFS